jgi:hypothetical protein
MANERERQFKCTVEGCGGLVPTEMPEGTLINKPTFSMLVMPHQAATLCPNCGQAYVFVLHGLNLRGQDVAWMPVVIEKKEDNDIIVPPLSMIDMKKLKGNN